MGYLNAKSLAAYTAALTSGNPRKSDLTDLWNLLRVGFDTREHFITVNNLGLLSDLPEGVVIHAGGVGYKRKAAATSIPDVPGFVPAEAGTPQHYGADGTAANDGPAFAALFAADMWIVIPHISGGYDLGVHPTIEIREGQHIVCLAATFRRTGGDTLMFDADGVSNWSWTGVTYAVGGLTVRVDYQPIGVVTTGGSATSIVDAGGAVGGSNNTAWPQRPAFAATGSTNAASVHVRTGANAGLSRAVVSASGDTITTAAFPNAFAAGDEYVLIGDEGFLRVNNCSRYKVEGISTSAMRGAGIHVTGESAATSQYGDEGQFSSLFADANTVGYWIEADSVRGPGAEYNQYSEVNATGCITGAIIGAGNQLITNLNVNGNVEDGAIFMDGYNNAHGIVCGAQCNHNGRFGWVFYKVSNGQTISASHTHERGIFHVASKGIQFLGGIYDAPRIYVYGTYDGELSRMRDMFMPGGYGSVVLQNEVSAAPSTFVLDGCFGAGAYVSGVSVNDPGGCYVHAKRSPGVLQSLSGHTQLEFPTDTFNRQAAYNPSTGVFTCPIKQAGQYRVKSVLYFSGVGVDPLASYAEVEINGGNPTLHLMNAFSTTIMTCVVERDVYLSEGDTVTIHATAGGSGAVSFGGATWASEFSIQRIA